MCDCFHLVLPNWPGSPASVSGRQLRPDDPDAETEEDNSVNEVPIDEIIRPRPQGSSPVYEYSIDQEHFIKGEDTQTGRFSLGRRKSRWKRDSGESQSFSGRSQSEEPMEVTLQTDVEAGASGYSVTGGGKEGIFVKQVLKDSSAAKLFSMREGDQLLSATIYFDNIKYEDALKILQYSEPYKVQFNLKRKLASKDDTEKVHHPATSDIRETDQQGEDLTDGTMETMEKMLEEEEDKEKLIVKSRTGRSQRPKKERLSWPKFQAKKTKKVVSHRRSHSTSDACEGRAPDLSPTSTDTELHFPKEETHLREKKGSERKSKFLNIGFRMHRKFEIDDKTSKSGMTTAEARTGTAKDGERISLDLQKPEMESGRLESQSATIIPEHLENEENRLKLQLQVDPGTKKEEQLTSEAKSMSGAVMGIPASVSGTLTGSHVSVRGRRKKSDDVTDTVSGSKHGLQAGKETREKLDDTSFGVRGLEIGIAKLTLQESQEDLEKGYETPEIRVKIPTLQTPKFGFSKGKVSEAKINVSEHEREQSLGKVTVNWGEMLMEHIPERNVPPLDVTGAVGKISVETPDLDHTVPNIPEKGAVISDGKAQISSKKMTQMPKADVSSPKMDIVISSADVSQPKVETHGPEIGKDGLKMEGEIKMGDKDIEGKDSKFKMPKFKIPSFGWSPSKEKKGSGEVSLPKEEVDISKASLKRDDKGGDLTVSLISAETPIRGIDLSMKSQKGEATVKDHKEKEEMRFKESKDQMENIQILQTSKADIEKTKIDIIIPRVDVSVPKVTLNKENVEAEVERDVKGDVRLKEKEIDHKESKFRIPKFSMPGFSWGSGKEIGSSVDIETNIKEPKTTIPSHSMDKEPGLVSKDKKVPSFDVNVQIAGGEKVKTESKTGKIPSIKVLKKADSEEKMMIERDVEGKKQDVESIDRNLKGKIEGIAEISQKEKTTIKGIEKEIQISELEVEIEEMKEKTKREGVKEHMTKYSIKTAKGDIKGPKVNITMPDIDVTIPKAKDNGITTEVQVERVKMEDDMKIGDKEVEVKDSKFKMPKFKMPSFGGGKEGAASVEVSLPKAEVDVTLPSVQAGDLSVEVPTVDVNIKGLDTEGQLPEGEIQFGDLKGKTGSVGLKGHLPTVHMPSVKMPQIPKADIKGTKVDITMPSMEVSLPKGKADIKSPKVEEEAVMVEGNIKLGDKEVEGKDSKFKMPKFKMPSFGGGKEKAASVDMSLPKTDVDVTLPSVQAGELSVEVSSAEVDIKGLDIEAQLPEVQLGDLKGKTGGVGLKGHLPSVKMPQMPKADIKGPKVDITMPTMDVSLPKGKGDIKSPAVQMEGDIKLGEKEVEVKDSKLKMPKFKMPSFGVSAPGKEGTAAVDASLPKAEVDVTLPSVEVEVKPRDLTVEVPSVDVDVKGLDNETKLPEGEVQLGDLKGKTEGLSLKGQLPKVHMPSMKMPQMPKADIKAPQVDITMPSLDVSLPKGKGDIKSPEVKMEGDIKLGDKEGEVKESKFKMPKFKMPSFGVSAPGKEGQAAVDGSLPKAEVDVTLPSVQSGDLSVEVPAVDVEIKGLDIETKLPEGEVQLGDLKGKSGDISLKGHLPKVHMPSMKLPQMPKADIKAPQVDITRPSLDVSLPKGEGDIKSPEVEVEGDIKLGDKEVEAKDSKFKMPKFKMPSFGGGKELAASVDVSLPKAEVDVTLPSVQSGDLSVEVPSVDVEVKGLDTETKLPEGEVQLGDLKGKIESVVLKSDLPKVNMASMKMPQMAKADIKGPKVDITMPSLDVSLPKAEVDVTLPSVQAGELSVEVPSAEVDIKGLDIEAQLPEVQLGDLKGKAGGVGLKGHLPSVKIPQMPKADIKGPKVDITMPSLDMSLPKGKGDIKSPKVEVEGDIKVGDKEVEAKDSKFKMPKFKMPSFGVSAPGKEGKAAVDVSLPKAEVDVTLPSVEVKVKPGEVSVEVPSVDVDVKGLDIETKMPEGEVQLGDLKVKNGDISLKGHLPTVHMPSMKMPQMPKADIKAPKVDITMPSLEVSLPTGKGNIKSPKVEVEGDIKLGDKEVEVKDSKFKMPKFKMPSFGGGKEGAASVDVSLPKTEVDVTLPSVQSSDLSVEMPSVDVEVKGLDIEGQLPEGVQLGDLKGKSGSVGLKGHLPTVHMPSMKMPQMPKADIKGPKVDITMPSLDVSLPKGKGDIKSPEVEMEGDIKLGDKEVEAKDSKFKMPKFKMPSFGVFAPGKEGKAAVDVSVPKAEVDVTLPSVQSGDLSVEVPSVDVEVKGLDIEGQAPEGEVQFGDLKGKSGSVGLKGHLPTVHMHSVKMPQMPKADIKGPKMDINIPSLDVSLPKGKGEIKSPEVQVEGDIKLGDKEVEVKGSKFKMPKFKMSAFGVSAPGKKGESLVDVSLPETEVDVTLPSVEVEVKPDDLSMEVPSVDVKGLDIQTYLPEGEVQLGDRKGKTEGISLKGHLPKVHMPSVKMPQIPKAEIKTPKVDITMPSMDVSLPKAEVDVTLHSVQSGDLSVEVPSGDVEVKGLDIETKLPEGEVQLGDQKGKTEGISLKGHLPKVHMPSVKMPQMPKADIKGPKVDITMPSLDVSLPKAKGDIKSPEVEVEGDIKLGDKEVEVKSSKFKMPKFKMPAFGVSAPGKKGEASVDVSLPKTEMDVTLPSVEVEVKPSDLSVEVSSVDVKGLDIETTLPEGEVQLGDQKGKTEGISLKGHLPKVHMPSMKMPQMPKADIKGPKVDITMPSLDVSLPKAKGDIKSPEVEVEGDIKLGDKEVEVKSSKFKMPKFKMPAFGASAPGKKGEASVDVSLPKTEMDVTLPSVEVEVKPSDLSVEVSSVDVKGLDIETTLPEGEVQLGDQKGKTEGISLKGHLPKVHMPSMKMPQMPKADIKPPKVDITMPSLDVSLPKAKGDIKSPEVEVEGDIKLGDKEVEAKDSKFKIPKFKMPSFGISAPDKEGKVSVDVSLPQADGDVTLASVEVDVKPGDLNVEVPSLDVEVKGLDIETKLQEGQVQLGDLKGKSGSVSLKGHLPKVHMPSVKMPQMPKVDIKGSKVDITMPSLDVSLPKGKGDIKSPEVEVEGDIKLGDKEMEVKDSKFKMPKFKMPSFGVSAPGKEGKAAVDASLPKAEVDVLLPSVQSGDLSVEVPSVDVEVKGLDIETKLPEGEVQLGDLKGKTGSVGLKGHLPKVHMPSVKMPQMPKADIKGPKMDITLPNLDVSLPKGKGDVKSPEVQVQAVKVEGEIKLGDKEVEAKDSKFKMPKFKMPSFGGGKEGAVSVNVSLPKAEVDVTLPSVQSGDLSVEVPSVDVEVKGLDIETKLLEEEVQLGDLKGKSGIVDLKGHLPKVHMPSMKMPQMPKADLKGPKVDITMPSLDVSLPKGKGDIKSPEVEVEGDIKLGDKEVEVKDSKFKMPKFKMPSFGVSVPSKEGKASMDVSLPKAEVDVPLPSVQSGDLSVEVPSVDVDVKGLDIETKLPEGEVQLGDLKGKTGSVGLKSDLPKVHMPSVKMPQMPKADIKGPKVDITLPSLDVSLPKGKGDVKSSEVQVEVVKVEGDIKLGDKEVEAKDSKFKMPKFKMPSFGGGKEGAVSVDMSLPKAEVDVTLPSVQAGDLSVEVPSVDVEVKGLDIETKLPEEEVQLGDLKGKSGSVDFKDHLPKVHMPSMKMPQMPKADIKAPQVDITMPHLDVSLPKGKGDIKSPEIEVEGDIKLGDKEVEVKDSKFKMPKFKMPSFGMSAPGKERKVSVDVSLPQAEVDVTLPSVEVEVKPGDLSVEVPSVDVDVKGLDIEGHLPKGEAQVGDRKEQSGSVGLKGHLPKVHMPSMKMPQMPKADIKGPKVDITMPSLDVSLPKGTVDIQGPQVDMEAVKVEGDIKLGEKEVEIKDSKFKMPKFKMPSFGSSHRRLHKSSVDTPSCHEPLDVSKSSPAFVHKEPEFSSVLQDDPLLCDSNLKVEGSRMKLHMPKMNIPSTGFSKDDSKVSKTSATVTCSSGETIMSSVDTSLPNLPATVGGTSGDIFSSDIPVPETDTKKYDFKVQLPKIAFPGHQFDGTLKPTDLKISSKRSECAVNLCEGELPEGELHVDIASSHLSDSRDGYSQFSGVSLPGLNFTKVNISGPHTEFGKTRVKEDITLTKYEVTLPMSKSHDIPSLPHSDTIPILDRHSIHLKSEEEESQISAGTWDERVEPLSYDPDGMIKFPKFYKPKFGVSVSKPLEISHPQEPPNVAAEMTAQEEPILFPKKEFMMSSETVKSFMHLSSVQTSLEGSDQMAVSDIQDSNIAPQTGKAEEVKPECTESEGKEGFFKMPKFKLPSFSWSPKKEAASKGAPGSKPSDILDKEQVAADTEIHTTSVETDMDVPTEKESPKEKIKKPHFMMPKIGLPKAKGSKAGIGLQKEAEELTHSDDAHIEEGSKKVIDTSSKKTVLDTKVFQIVAPTVIRQTELQVTEGLAPGKTTTQEPSGDKESGKEQLFLPVVQVPKLGSSVSQVKSHSIHISVPKLETDMSQPSPTVDIETVTLETETYADVLKRNIDDKSLKLCQTTAGMLDSTISISEVSVPSGENTVSLLMPSLGFSTSEIKDPRQETGETVLPQHDMSMPRPQAIAKGEKDVGLPESEMYLLPTEGPIKLKTSSTEIPSQVSMIETSRVWEGSVLTVKFPKLQIPKFTFQAPNTEADIFIPKVREVMCPETDIEIAIHKESPDEWSAKVLKAVSEIPPQPSPDPIRPPKDLALSSVASPISKVKVHIQGAHIESQEVTIESRVTCEHGELPRRETFSTQIVKGSEIPPSDIQTPSYGFSLLKVKIPESHVNLDVTGKEQETLGYTSSTLETQDISEESLRKDELGVDTDLSLEGELQPETGEPYEIISSSASLPKLKTFTFEVHSSHQYVDSYSDEEPAEILEFPPEDSHDQISPDEEKEQKVQSESKKSSGLFRFWLPSIGFSSSVDEANSDSKTELSKSVPIQTQPEAMSDIEPKKPEKTGWFRFPKLGFSSSPAKKSKSTEESVTEPTKSGSQEEAEQTVIFFDAQETLSPEEREGGESITSTTNDDAQEPGALVTSSARTELILLEEEGKTAGKTGSGHVAK
ncbi:protein AHNAK2 isoform X2 [Sarcophilus harrisii]|uniref:protein AHNAK2 isoform X2 n=1 Tax=Sarcophilus harrisii TaxID=9305 RepID=UPI001301F73A|nr:protein AHNAK2 isoform X2 [Sarcophilus harrisii]